MIKIISGHNQPVRLLEMPRSLRWYICCGSKKEIYFFFFFFFLGGGGGGGVGNEYYTKEIKNETGLKN